MSLDVCRECGSEDLMPIKDGMQFVWGFCNLCKDCVDKALYYPKNPFVGLPEDGVE